MLRFKNYLGKFFVVIQLLSYYFNSAPVLILYDYGSPVMMWGKFLGKLIGYHIFGILGLYLILFPSKSDLRADYKRKRKDLSKESKNPSSALEE